MSKRKMPPHIVLPDGRWRFVKRGHKAASRVKRHHKIGGRMAKHKKYGRGGGSKKFFGLSSRGLVGSFGLLGVVGAALFSDQIAAMVPVNLPFRNYLAAFAIAGPAGVGAKVAKDMLAPGLGGGSSGGVILY